MVTFQQRSFMRSGKSRLSSIKLGWQQRRRPLQVKPKRGNGRIRPNGDDTIFPAFRFEGCFKPTVWKAWWYVTRSFVWRSHGTCVCTMVQLDNTASRHNHQRVQKLRWDSVQPVWLRNNTDLTTNVDTVQFHSRCFNSTGVSSLQSGKLGMWPEASCEDHMALAFVQWYNWTIQQAGTTTSVSKSCDGIQFSRCGFGTTRIWRRMSTLSNFTRGVSSLESGKLGMWPEASCEDHMALAFVQWYNWTIQQAGTTTSVSKSCDGIQFSHSVHSAFCMSFQLLMFSDMFVLQWCGFWTGDVFGGWCCDWFSLRVSRDATSRSPPLHNPKHSVGELPIPKAGLRGCGWLERVWIEWKMPHSRAFYLTNCERDPEKFSTAQQPEMLTRFLIGCQSCAQAHCIAQRGTRSCGLFTRRQTLLYRVTPFGAVFSAFWWARLGGLLLRIFHHLIWWSHAGFLDVDDFLFFMEANMMPVSATLVCIFC